MDPTLPASSLVPGESGRSPGLGCLPREGSQQLRALRSPGGTDPGSHVLTSGLHQAGTSWNSKGTRKGIGPAWHLALGFLISFPTLGIFKEERCLSRGQPGSSGEPGSPPVPPCPKSKPLPLLTTARYSFDPKHSFPKLEGKRGGASLLVNELLSNPERDCGAW